MSVPLPPESAVLVLILVCCAGTGIGQAGVPEAVLRSTTPLALQSAQVCFTREGRTMLVLRHYTNRHQPLVTAHDVATGRRIFPPLLATDLYGTNEPRNGEEGVTLVLSPREDVFLTASFQTVRLWSMNKGKALSPLLEHPGNVAALFSSDGKSVLTLSLLGGRGRKSDVQYEFRQYDAYTGRMLGDPSRGTAPDIQAPGPLVKSLLRTPDESKLLVCYGGGVLEAKSLRLWDARTLKYDAEPMVAQGDHHQFSPDGKTLLAASKKGIALWDVARREKISELPTPKVAKRWIGRQQNRINSERWYAFHPGGSRVLLIDDRSVDLWDLAAAPAQKVLTLENPDTVYWIALSQDGKRAAAAMGDRHAGQVLVWDLERKEPRLKIPHYEPIRAMEFSPEGRNLAIVDGGEVRVWSLEAMK